MRNGGGGWGWESGNPGARAPPAFPISGWCTHPARTDLASGQSVQAAECVAHERRHRGGEPARGRGAGRVHGPQMRGQPIFNRLALIGMGLIGSSIARATRAQGTARSIVATARSAATRRRVAELGLADQVVETNAAAAEGADLVIF